MHEVEDLFPGVPCRTRVWVSDQAAAAIAKYLKKRKPERVAMLAKIRAFAEHGFPLFQGKDRPIRLEWREVYRIEYRQSSLFRLIGFYSDDGRTEFIIMDAFLKTGQDLTPAQRDRIDVVADVKRDGLWRRRQ